MNKPEIKKVGMALQGGGAHGAFTWGVLDRLLEACQLTVNYLEEHFFEKF